MLASSSVKWLRDHFSLKFFLSVLLFPALSLGGGTFFYLKRSYEAPLKDSDEQIVVIPSRMSLENIALLLKNRKVISDSQSFIWNARLRGFHRYLKAGEYKFPKNRSLKDILQLLASGKVIVHKITVIEGQPCREIFKHLKQISNLTGDLKEIPLEGSLFPETYHYTYGQNRQALILRMQKAQTHHMNRLWGKRDPKIPLLSPSQALILASIVEKETPLMSEKPRIAGLFYNRLRLKMKLQSDPTVSYGLYLLNNRPLNQALSRAELLVPTAHNTYIHEGLPPTSICNPSLSSLQAVLHPFETSDLYFVTDGTGGHVFSSTYAEHQRYHQALRQRRLSNQPKN